MQSFGRRAILALAGAFALAGSLAPAAIAAPADEPAIAAAADLNAALPQIADLFRRKTGRTVKLTFGASGNLTQQILNGAPFQLFLSADESYVARLAEAGRTVDGGTLYATGRIGLFTPRGSPVKADGRLADLAAAIRDGRLRKFAIANPEHAPYGRAAREALTTAKLWDAIQPRLVLGENVAQATQFATSGSADGGIIPLSLAMTPQVQAAGRFALIPAEWHKPLRQRAVLMKGAGETARAFYAFMQSPEAHKLLDHYGFTLPRTGQSKPR
ncbi:molybdate ABC transporter substrate-binding protein [Sphingomonas sp. MM-1]|uniref:molybdate ABC transporter substrate-binding protein n=1 Tax=Sphingomonas sp. MM-1 TaxID=745310 RepID=UPI0002C09DFD|nr:MULTISPECIES: molybdate ABC transporter substrate-binding protein [unclassified Sphingomonas]AGH51077.1 molybdate ABC transporter substrate-binding protein [Sphingomonas sp. MM-1]MDX3886040.1 molybdate ABC transporter substrate-binding protein [Sphingomonas sp.]